MEYNHKYIGGCCFKEVKLYEVYHSPEDLIKAIDKHKPNAACGDDGVSARLIKRLKLPITTIISHIFRKSMRTGSFPSILKNAVIIGIFKNGDKKETKNYWQIAKLWKEW